MNESQRRAYDALGLGPRWLSRSAVRGEEADLTIDQVAPILASAEVVFDEPDARVLDEPVTRVLDEPVARGLDEPIDVVARLDWLPLAERVAGCQACGLCRSRRQTVFGVGQQPARWMIIGEAPGAEEDLHGEPFVGQAGRLLDNMLASIGLSRERDVFIANVLKCRPPGNRNPEPAEVAACAPFLRRQMELVQPEVVLLMGRFAAQTILDVEASIASLRGRVHTVRIGQRDVPTIVTYHPAYLLRSLPDKAKAWRDLLQARRLLVSA